MGILTELINELQKEIKKQKELENKKNSKKFDNEKIKDIFLENKSSIEKDIKEKYKGYKNRKTNTQSFNKDKKLETEESKKRYRQKQSERIDFDISFEEKYGKSSFDRTKNPKTKLNISEDFYSRHAKSNELIKTEKIEETYKTTNSNIESLKTRSEARKAFIHSVIFERKI